MTRLLVIEGDGIGPEICAATVGVLQAADERFRLGLSFDTATVGLAALAAHGTTFPPSTLEAAQAADGVVLGPVSHNDYPPADKGGLKPSG
jgi:isocitrate/isopropylmalate dehydrogenase